VINHQNRFYLLEICLLRISRAGYKVSLLVYKCLHLAAPSYLAEMCVPVSATDNWCHLCSATHGDLAVTRVRLARYGRRSFSVSGPLLWNSLPLTVRDASLTLTQFCARLKTFSTGHHHSASVTVSAIKFVCINTNLLTYLRREGGNKHCFSSSVCLFVHPLLCA